MARGLAGLRVAGFESRRASELAALVRKQGGEPIAAPAMQEVPLADQDAALAFGESLLAGRCDVLVLLTGVGARLLVDALALHWPRSEIVAALGRTALVCRGPKPVAALRELGLVPSLRVPEPNTWRELLAALDAGPSVAGRRIAVQEYGRRNAELLDALRERGADVVPVPVYAWKLPDDRGPLRRAVERLLGGELDAALFTSRQQAENLFAVAREVGQDAALRTALGKVVVASIGPVTSDALRALGVEPDLEPERPRMGLLVAALARSAHELLARKQRA